MPGWKELHLFTIGASSVLNTVRVLVEKGDPLIEKYPLLEDIRKIPPFSEEQAIIEAWAKPGGDIFEALLEILEANPEGASAELNAYYGFRKEMPWGETAKILLFHTDTGLGRLAAMLLYEYLGRHIEVEGVRHSVEPPLRINGFGLGPDYWDEALANTITTIGASALQGKRSGYKVFLNATGGFKPEVSFALVVSLLAGIDEAYYIHEVARQIVLLPKLPISLNSEITEALAGIDGLTLGEARNSIPGNLLQARGYTLEDLERMGLVELRGDRLKLKRWVRELLALT